MKSFHILVILSGISFLGTGIPSVLTWCPAPTPEEPSHQLAFDLKEADGLWVSFASSRKEGEMALFHSCNFTPYGVSENHSSSRSHWEVKKGNSTSSSQQWAGVLRSALAPRSPQFGEGQEKLADCKKSRGSLIGQRIFLSLPPPIPPKTNKQRPNPT